MPGIIEMKNVSFSAQTRKLVTDISCLFEEAKTTALVGPSGGGKSTVLKLAAGLIIPEAGQVFFRNKDIARMNRTENLTFRREGAVVFQDSALWANQTLYQILELPLRVHFPFMARKEREKRIESVVASVGYRKELGVRPAQLSMGEQKLIAFSRAMICRPRLLYLDEWTESLDDKSSYRLISLVKELQDDGVTIIIISHDIRTIRDLSDVVLLVQEGQIFLRLTREEIGDDEELRQYIERGIDS